MTKNELQILCQKLISKEQIGVKRAILYTYLKYSFLFSDQCPKNRKAEDGRINAKYLLNELPQENDAAQNPKKCHRT